MNKLPTLAGGARTPGSPTKPAAAPTASQKTSPQSRASPGSPTRPAVSRPGGSRASATPSVRVLAIDAGGGASAALPLLVLAELERLAGSRIAALFDLVVGVSTGGVAALALTRHEAQPAAEIAVEFLGKGAAFVESLRSGVADEAAVGAAHADLVSALVGKGELQTHNPRVAALAYDPAACQGVLLRSWDPDTGGLAADLVGRATTAAPIVLPAVDVKGKALRDGSMALSTPALQAWAEAKKTFPADHPIVLVSLGCGRPVVPGAPANIASIVEGVTVGGSNVVGQALASLLGLAHYIRIDARASATAPLNCAADVEAEAKAVILENASVIEGLAHRLKK